MNVPFIRGCGLEQLCKFTSILAARPFGISVNEVMNQLVKYQPIQVSVSFEMSRSSAMVSSLYLSFWMSFVGCLQARMFIRRPSRFLAGYLSESSYPAVLRRYFCKVCGTRNKYGELICSSLIGTGERSFGTQSRLLKLPRIIGCSGTLFIRGSFCAQ